MSEQFYSILTDIGKAKIANATSLGNKVEFTSFALGDGGGSYYNPVDSQIALKSEVWRGNIGQVAIDENNPNWMTLETIVPSEVGGFTIREAGIFDLEGDLIAIGKYPETYKPTVSSGSSKDLYIKMIIEVSNTSAVTLKVDKSVVLATKKDIEILENYVDSSIESSINDLAGVGRTNETVKTNAEDISALSSNLINLVKVKSNILISKMDWTNDILNSGYYICDITDPDITGNTIVDINIHLSDLKTAQDAEIQSVVESYLGYARIYSKIIPTTDLTTDMKLTNEVGGI